MQHRGGQDVLMCTVMKHVAVFMDQLSTLDLSTCRVERGIKIIHTIALSFVTSPLPQMLTTLSIHEYCHMSIAFNYVA
jgi:hypothetical protein